MKHAIIHITCYVFTAMMAWSQAIPTDSYALKTFIPPSPNAASLGKYGDIPVSYHTGIPNISIPLYQLKEGDVTLPLSLSYHASGIRVSEVASWVGLGWTLNAGGAITRSMQHGPDEGPLPGKVHDPPPPYWINGGVYHTGYYRDGFTLPPGYEDVENFETDTDPSFATYNAMMDAAQGNSDTEPDIFFFNIPGYSGKFLFKVDVDTLDKTITRTPLFIPRSDIRLEVLYGDLLMPHYPSGYETRETFIGFILTTPDGFKYHFGGANAIDYTANQVFNLQNHNESVSVVLAPSSWYLTRIESPVGRHIDLEYTRDTFGYYDLAPERCWSGNEYLSLADQMISRSVVNGAKLSRISSGTEEILFMAETIREDLGNYENSGGGEETNHSSSKRLDRIEINSIDHHPAKRFVFGYDYFRSPANSIFPKFIEDDAGLKSSFTTDRSRLRLNDVTEVSGDGTTVLPPYSFQYIDDQPLPRRLSYQQDHWGYNNHATANTGLISFWVNPRKNDRETDPQYSQAGTLKSIRYPTGGITTFTYESHEAITIVESNEEDPGRNYVVDSWTATGNGGSDVVSFATAPGVELPEPCRLLGLMCNTFTIELRFRAGSPTGGIYDLNYLDFKTNMALEIYRVGDSAPYMRYEFGGLNDCEPGNITCAVTSNNHFREVFRKDNIDLPYGQYYAKAYRLEGLRNGIPYLFTAAFNIQIAADRDPNFQSAAVNRLTKVGGLRIRSIVTSDGSGTFPDQVRTFTYPATGGVLFSRPQYYYRIQWQYDRPYSGYKAIKGATFQQLWSSGSVLPMRTTQGNHIGYAWVTEEQAGNGYKKYSYDVAEHPYHFANDPWFKGNTYDYEAPGRQYNYPVYPAPMDMERGNLLAEEVFDNNDKLVKATYYSYEPADDVVLMRASKVDFIKAPLFEPTWYVSYTHYPILTSTNRIKTTTLLTNFDSNGYNPTSVITSYDYGSTNHLQATSVTRTMDDVEYVDHVIYPPDYGNIFDNLLKANVIDVPIEKYTVRRATGSNAGEVTSGTVTQFKPDRPLKAAVYSLKLSQPVSENTFRRSNSIDNDFKPHPLYERRLSFDNYDAVGNIRDLSREKDIRMSYLWGYSNSRPIAEVKNASSSQIFHTSFENLEYSFSDSSLTGRKSFVGSYTVTPPATGASFRLTYWKKSTLSSPWQLVENNINSPTVIGGTGVLLDEVRLYPSGAQMTTYTYEIPWGISTVTDPNNLVTRYYYDSMGRLRCIKDHDGNIIKTFSYYLRNQ